MLIYKYIFVAPDPTAKVKFSQLEYQGGVKLHLSVVNHEPAIAADYSSNTSHVSTCGSVLTTFGQLKAFCSNISSPRHVLWGESGVSTSAIETLQRRSLVLAEVGKAPLLFF